MWKILDNTNLGYFISKIKAAFWPKDAVQQISIDSSPTSESTNLVTSGGVYTALNDKAPKVSPALTGTPTAPTATAGTNTTQIATTAFVTDAVTTATIWEAGTGENSVVVKGCEGIANGIYSTVEGYQSETGGNYTENTKEATVDSSAGSYAHAEGVCTIASGAKGSHAEGRFTLASSDASHAEGNRTVASGAAAHTEGIRTIASGTGAHAEGYSTKSSNDTSHAEGFITESSGYASHAEGYCSKAIGSRSHVEGTMTKAYGSGSHAENGNWWIDITSITGSANTTSYVCTFSKVNKVNEIVELYETLGSTKFINLMKTASLCKSGYGQDTFMIAVTNVSNISLSNNILTCTFTLEKTLSETALSNASNYRISTNGSFGNFSHAENGGSAIGYDSHAEGSSSYSIGDESHAEGYVTLALNDYEHAQGTYNKSTKTSSTFGNAGNTIHSVGIGTSVARKNAEEIMQNGDMYLIGVGDYDGTNFSEAQTVQQVINGFNDAEEVTSAALNDLNDHISDLNDQIDSLNNDLVIIRDEIPANVTESTVSNWGFTKNIGTTTGVKLNGTTNYPISGIVDLGTITVDTSDCEKIINKVNSISSSSTDTQYPSAKCVYDIVGNIELALDEIITPTPIITTSESELTFVTTVGTAVSKTFTLRGYYLRGNVNQNWSASAGFTRTPTATIVKADAEMGTPVFTITFNPSSQGTYSGSITFSSTAAESVIVTFTGTAE